MSEDLRRHLWLRPWCWTGSALPSVQTEAAEADYEIYPNPHVIEYQDGNYIISDVNVVFESGIDDATKNRLTETLELKSDVNVTESEAIVDGMTNILVGIDGSGEYADTYAKEHHGIYGRTFRKAGLLCAGQQ